MKKNYSRCSSKSNGKGLQLLAHCQWGGLATIGADHNVRLSLAIGKAATRCGRIRPVVNFSVEENIHTDVLVGEEEELVLAKSNSVTSTPEEDRRLDSWLSREKKKHERSSRGGAGVLLMTLIS